jgi:hypothetical protein
MICAALRNIEDRDLSPVRSFDRESVRRCYLSGDTTNADESHVRDFHPDPVSRPQQAQCPAVTSSTRGLEAFLARARATQLPSEVDVLALVLIRIESVEAALHDESRESDELSEGTDLLLGSVPHGVFLLGLGRSESVRSLGFESAGVEGVVGLILAVLVLAKGAFLYVSVDISQI